MSPAPVLRAAAVGSTATALVLGWVWSDNAGPVSAVVLGALAMAALIAGVVLWWRDVFEVKAVLALTMGLVALGALLRTTVGLPGGPGGEVTPVGTLLMVLALWVGSLLALDTRRRTRTVDV